MPLDPDAQRVLDMIALAARPPMEQQTPEQCRAQYREARRVMQGPPPAVADVWSLDAGGVPVRCYRGFDAREGPALLYAHGGGWVIGDLDSHDGVCRVLANEARCRVVSVDYRLAPEHRSPAAFEDCVTALGYVASQGAALGIDPAQIAVGGDSAGGHLAALLAIAGRDGRAPRSCFQMLFYPAVDLTCSTPAYQEFASGVNLTAGAMRWFRDHYLGGANPADPAVSPARAELRGLPPAFVLTAGYDPLRDEGVAYAKALDAAGVAVTHLHMATQIHGFLTMSRIVRAGAPVLAMAAAAMRLAWGG